MVEFIIKTGYFYGNICKLPADNPNTIAIAIKKECKMKDKTIGQLMLYRRDRMHMSIKDVTSGICSQSTYSRYESEESIPDMFTASFILQRMGTDTSGIQYVSSYSEAEAYKLRKMFDAVSNMTDLLQYEDLIKYYNERYAGKNIHKQYGCLLMGKISKQKGQIEEARKYYYDGYRLTHDNKDSLLQPFYALQEFELLISYLILTDNTLYWKALHEYLEGRGTYDILRLNYSGIVTRELCKAEQNDKLKEGYLTRTLTYLKETNALKGTKTLLGYKFNGCNGEIESGGEEYELYNSIKQIENISSMVENNDVNRRLITKGELIRSLRNELGMTQEELADGICDVSALARYEAGKLDPGREKFEGLLMKMHRAGINYRFSYNTGVFSDQEAYMKIEKHFEKHEEDEAVREFYINSILLDAFMDEHEKEQIRGRMSLLARLSDGAIDKETYISELESLILKTINDYHTGHFSLNRIMNETEISILNMLGIAYNACSEYEKRDAVYANIKDYVFKNNMPFNSAINKALTNYCEYLGQSGRLDECYDFSKKIVRELLNCPTQNMLYISAYSIACYLHETSKDGKNSKNCDKEARAWIRLSLTLGHYFDESEIAVERIQGYYEEKLKDKK